MIELKIKMKDFFLKIWAQNMHVHYPWKNMVFIYCVYYLSYATVIE